MREVNCSWSSQVHQVRCGFQWISDLVDPGWVTFYIVILHTIFAPKTIENYRFWPAKNPVISHQNKTSKKRYGLGGPWLFLYAPLWTENAVKKPSQLSCSAMLNAARWAARLCPQQCRTLLVKRLQGNSTRPVLQNPSHRKKTRGKFYKTKKRKKKCISIG